MRVLITGGAGFIGGHLARSFVATGDRVTVLDNLATGNRENVPPEAELIEGDLRERADVFGALELAHPDVVLHLGAQADVRRSMDDPTFDASVNLLGTLHVLEGARRHGAAHVVFASTGGAIYGEPTSIPVPEGAPALPLSCYGASKRAAEDYLRIYAASHGVRTTALRYANVYGPRQNPKGEAGVVAIFSLLLLTGKRPTIFGDGAKTRDYVYVEDVVRANRLVVARGIEGVFNIGTGRQVTDQAVFDAVRDAVGTKESPIYGMRRKGEVEHIALDARHAAEILGWRPEVPFEEGVRRAVAYYREWLARGD